MALKTMRKRANLTQKQLSEVTGISYFTIIAYERNGRNIEGCKLANLVKICKVLNCKLSDIVDDEELAKELREVGC